MTKFYDRGNPLRKENIIFLEYDPFMSATKKNIILLRKPGASDWISCHFILENLISAHWKIHGNDLFIVETSDLESIAKINPDIIIIADHRLNFEHVVGAIKSVCPKPIDWIIYAYGCFSMRATEFINAYYRMKDDRFKLITGSYTNKRIVDQFFKNPDLVEWMHFPFNENHTSPPLPSMTTSPEEIVLIYAGRISYQKNVHKLIKGLREKSKTNNLKIKLIICGEVDTLNPKVDSQGSYPELAGELFKQELQLGDTPYFQTEYLGKISNQEVIARYQTADCFISLSTHYGEDFGFAVAEALATGLPVILSPWGGYKDFKSLKQVQYVKMSKVDDDYQFDFQAVDFTSAKAGAKMRQANIQNFLNVFGIQKFCSTWDEKHLKFQDRCELTKTALRMFQLRPEFSDWESTKLFLESKLMAPYSD